jgi:hypothetical protein
LNRSVSRTLGEKPRADSNNPKLGRIWRDPSAILGKNGGVGGASSNVSDEKDFRIHPWFHLHKIDKGNGETTITAKTREALLGEFHVVLSGDSEMSSLGVRPQKVRNVIAFNS